MQSSAEDVHRLTNTCALLKTLCAGRRTTDSVQLRSVLELMEEELEFLNDSLKMVVGFYHRLKPIPALRTEGTDISTDCKMQLVH